MPDLDQLIPNVTKFVSMTKFDGSGAVRRWLHVLDEELAGQLRPNTWLKRADARLDGRAASWAERTPEIISIFSNNAIDNETEAE